MATSTHQISSSNPATYLSTRGTPTSFEGSSSPASLPATVAAPVSFHDSSDIGPLQEEDGGCYSGQPRQRSRMGCFTCRKRKKRCDEGKPVCQACVRLKLECEYPLPGQERKNRKRKSYANGNQSIKQENESEMLKKELSDYHLGNNHRSTTTHTETSLDPSLSTNHALPSPRSSLSNNEDEEPKKRGRKKHTALSKRKTISDDLSDNEVGTSLGKKMRLKYGNHSTEHSPNHQPTQSLKIPKLHHEDSHRQQDNNLLNSSPGSLFGTSSGAVSSAMYRSTHNQPHNILSHDSPKLPLQLEQPVQPTPGSSTYSVPSPASSCSSHSSSSSYDNNIDHHARIITGNQANPNSFCTDSPDSPGQLHNDTAGFIHMDSDIMEQLSMTFSRRQNSQSPDPSGFSPSAVFSRGLHGLMASPPPPGQNSRILELNGDEEGDDEDNTATLTRALTKSPSSEFLHNHKSPLSSFDPSIIDPNFFHSSTLSQLLDGTSDHFFLGSPGRNFSDPVLLNRPTPWYALQLDKFGASMFEYYSTYLANIICVSSGNLNAFLDIFVPMAQEDSAVLYALVAYASFHHSMGKNEEVGIRYLNKAMEMVRNDLPKHKLTTLACILLIATAEICNGDMLHWDKHLEAAAAVIKTNGGLSNFVDDRTKRWLATNFFYHEILGASKNSQKTHFKAIEYEQVLRSDFGVHSLIGCCKSIFFLMAQLSDLAVEAQEIHARLDNSEGIGYSHELRRLFERARELELQIDNCQPDSSDIISLSSKDQEEQLTLFETFQITAKIHLQQSVLRRNASSVNMQILASDLIESLSVVLTTKVEGSLVFPLFMASIMSTRPHTRAAMLDRFDMFYKRNLARNILRAKDLVEEVWSLDCEGTKYVNWYGLIQAHGFDICFA